MAEILSDDFLADQPRRRRHRDRKSHTRRPSTASTVTSHTSPLATTKTVSYRLLHSVLHRPSALQCGFSFCSFVCEKQS